LCNLVLRFAVLSLLPGILLLWAHVCTGDLGITVRLMGGLPYNLKAPLEISQNGNPDIRFSASYESKPFEQSYYYDFSVSRWRGDEAWSIDFLHHKIHLKDGPAEVQDFAVSHGYNIFTLRRLWNRNDNIISLGAGAVVTHPESTIRGCRFHEKGGIANRGFYVSGPVLDAGIARRLPVNEDVFLSAELRGTLSYVSVPIADGRAKLTHAAIHFLVGVGAGI
jgi:hypothetical protein